MSLIKKIVEIVERSDNTDARKNIAKLNRDCQFHKEKVKQYIDANYVEFLPTIINNESLLQEGKNLENQLMNMQENLSNETKSIYKANDEMSKLIEELEEANVKLNLSMKLVNIDKLLATIKQLNEDEKYKEINGVLNNIQLLINDPDDNIIRRLDLYKNVKEKLSYERLNLLHNLEARFNQLVNLKEKSFLKTRSISISITKNSDKLIDCMNSIKDSDYDFSSLTDFLMRNVFEPVACRAVSLELGENESSHTASLSYSTEPVTEELRPNYAIVFSNVYKILSYLNNMNVALNSGEFFLAHVFHERRKEFLEMIFSKCLIHSIPKTFEEKTQSTMNADIAKMDNLFVELNFFQAPTADGKEPHLEDYSPTIDELFYHQFTQNILASASELLKKDLHDMMPISEDTTISTSTPLVFPRSMVSKSTLELIRLLEKIINQAKACTGDADKQNNLMVSIKAVLENYTFTVQLHHAKFMSQIPQQSALFYNNCMYLSNWVTTNRETEHFGMEQVSDDLEKQGWEVLECQIEKQKIQLVQILSDFHPSQSLNDVQPEHFKPIRQCLRQLDLLKNVWQTILPSGLYNKTIASLLDVVSLDLIKKVTAMEDISTKLGSGLVDLIKSVDEKGQSLFGANTSALTAVGSWQKMHHLQFILDASLVDITSSWKAGQISQSFKVEEVKRLIRALFQNTDRRANALSSIV